MAMDDRGIVFGIAIVVVFYFLLAIGAGFYFGIIRW